MRQSATFQNRTSPAEAGWPPRAVLVEFVSSMRIAGGYKNHRAPQAHQIWEPSARHNVPHRSLSMSIEANRFCVLHRNAGRVQEWTRSSGAGNRRLVREVQSTVCIRKYYASQLLCFFEIWKTLGSVSKIRKYYVSQILCFSPYYCRGFLTAFPTTVEKCRTASSNFTQTRKCGFNKKLHRCGNEVCSDLYSQTSAARTTLRAV